jgi:hypothetical protein
LIFSSFSPSSSWEVNSSKSLLRKRLGYNNKRCPPILSGKMDDPLFYLAQSTAACVSQRVCGRDCVRHRSNIFCWSNLNQTVCCGLWGLSQQFRYRFQYFEVDYKCNCKTIKSHCARYSNVFFTKLSVDVTLKLSQAWP